MYLISFEIKLIILYFFFNLSKSFPIQSFSELSLQNSRGDSTHQDELFFIEKHIHCQTHSEPQIMISWICRIVHCEKKIRTLSLKFHFMESLSLGMQGKCNVLFDSNYWWTKDVQFQVYKICTVSKNNNNNNETKHYKKQ